MKISRKKTASSGFILVMSLAILILISLVFFPLLQRFRSRSVENAQYISKDSAFMLAREGIHQGLWYLNISSGVLQAVQAGQKITGYKGDVSYNDDPTGGYNPINATANGNFTINISSGPGIHQITIISVAHPKNQKVSAIVKAVYEDASVNAAVYVESNSQVVDMSVTNTLDCQGMPNQNWSLSVTNIPQIHWGAIKSLRSMDVTDGPFFPRKYAQNRIISRDNGSIRYNSDGKEYWANTSDIDPPPLFNLSLMKSQAQNNTDNNGSSTYVAVSSTVGNIYLATRTTWYYEGNLTLTGPVFYRGIVIVMGDLTINNSADSASQTADGQNVPIPPTATAEYMAAGGYPADSELQADPTITQYSFTPNQLAMRAFVYVNGNVTINNVTGPNQFTIYGAMYVRGKMTVSKQANFRVYYGVCNSPSAGASDPMSWPAVTRPSWKKILWDETLLSS